MPIGGPFCMPIDTRRSAELRHRLGAKAGRAFAEIVDEGKKAEPCNATLVQARNSASASHSTSNVLLSKKGFEHARHIDRMIN